ncbi:MULTISPECIES: GIY-YIG nuclease family protein [Hyphobacterium]|uniref:GIY-YIG nuclease family protein n=1 Tax=Hyphobacterium vulgare TaxID=1736751 RepID=A0ABV6ZVE7_9PROT
MPAYFYMMASRPDGVLYCGSCNNIAQRVQQHRSRKGSVFVSRFNVFRLVYLERFDTTAEAILREKRIKKWNRAWKVELIETANPEWDDLSSRLNDILPFD